MHSLPAARTCLFFLLLCFVFVCPAFAGNSELTFTCKDCHERAPLDISEAGAAHQSEVACWDCHVGHPPKTADNIPQCAACHMGEIHYDEAGECYACHTNPHRPLELTLASDLTAPCLTCHQGAGQTFQEYTSYHSELSCTGCHASHAEVPRCTSCHMPHEEGEPTRCDLCHQGHKPLEVAYLDEVPQKACASCHSATTEQVVAGETAHTDVNCSSCHEQQHGNIPQCAQCHEPHSETMVQQDCLLCHQAHVPAPVTLQQDVPAILCSSCHSDTFQTWMDTTTKHGSQRCDTCHEQNHGYIPSCTDCHAPHQESMTNTECYACHQAHSPLPATFASETASQLCASCHTDQMGQLQQNPTKHTELTCATCHSSPHGTIPNCQDCHGSPHSEQLMSKFPDCGACHQSAHNLML